MAIDPKLVSIKTAGELPVSDPSDNANFLFYEGDTLQRSPMSNIYDKVSSGLLPATTTTVPEATGVHRYLVHTAGTYTNFSGIVVTAADLDIVNGVANNEVILEVNNGVATKRVRRVKGDKGDKTDISELVPNYKTGTIPKTTAKTSGMWVGANGVIETSTNYSYFEFIRVDGVDYWITGGITATPGFKLVHYYNAAGVYISSELTSVGSPFIYNNYKLTIPTGTVIIRIGTNLAGTLTVIQTNVRAASVNYVSEINDKVDLNKSILAESLPNFKAGTKNRALTKISGKWIAANGAIETNANYAYFEFINRGLEYWISGSIGGTPNFFLVHYFDANGLYISSELNTLVAPTFTYTDYKLTVPENTLYIRVGAKIDGTVSAKETDIRSASVNYVNEVNDYAHSLVSLIDEIKTAQIPDMETEYQAVLNTFETLPELKVMQAQNEAIQLLKKDGIWDKIDVLQIYATSSVNNALVNFKNPTGKKALILKTPIFTKNKGFTGSNGGCVNTNFTPSIDGVNVTIASHAYLIGVNSDNDYSGIIYDMGAYDGVNYIAMKTGDGGIYAEYFRNSPTSLTLSNEGRRKRHIGFSKFSTYGAVNLDYGYSRGVSPTVSSLLSKPIYVCGLNDNGNSTVANNSRIVSYFISAGGLETHEHLRTVEIMENYLVEIGSPIQDIIAVDSVVDSKELVLYETPFATAGQYGREVIHPSVKDLGKKVNGFRYWSANTPYPIADGSYELPSIFVSDDLVNWYPPTRDVNPLFSRIAGVHLYSDTDLIYDNDLGKFFMYFRNTNFSPAASKICVIESINGIDWDINPAQATNDYKVVLPVACLTPSIKKVGNKYYMYVLSTPLQTVITRYECDTPNGTFTNPTVITGLEGTNINHFSYLFFKGKHYLAVAKSEAEFVFFLTSTDGVNFTRTDRFLSPLRTSKPYENISISAAFYRPDLVVLNGEVWIYYSMGTGGSGAYGNICARVKLKGL